MSSHSDEPSQPGEGGIPTAALEGDIQDIVVIMEELQHQLRQAREVNRTLQSELEQEKARGAGLQKLADARADDVGQLKGQLAGIQEESERLLSDLGITNEERIDTAQEIRRLRERLDHADGESRALTNQIRELREAAEVSQGATADRLRSMDARLEELLERIERQERELEQRGQALSAAKEKIDTLTEDNERLQAEVANLEHCRGDLEKVRSLMQAFALSDVDA